jgi:hypothetical protein
MHKTNIIFPNQTAEPKGNLKYLVSTYWFINYFILTCFQFPVKKPENNQLLHSTTTVKTEAAEEN